jgi:hypothetical protein
MTTESDALVVADNGWDELTATDLGESFALSQVAEDGTLHNVVISVPQAQRFQKWVESLLAA